MSFTLVWARTCPPSASEAWTIQLIERESRYWVDAQLGRKTNKLFEPGTHKAWE